MLSNFPLKSTVSAIFSIGFLISCGGSNSSSNDNELPYVLPAGTKIIITCGKPQEGFVTENGVRRPMLEQELVDINWDTRTFSLTVAVDGIGRWQIFGVGTGSQYLYTRVSPTTFTLAASWPGGTINFSECELPSIKGSYGTVGRWECYQVAAVLFGRAIPMTLVGGGTNNDSLQYSKEGESQ